MSDWQPIETAPKDGANILAFCDGSILFARWHTVSDSARARGWPDGWYGSSSVTFSPTHWMPLPSPPKPAEVKTDEMALALVDSVGDVRAYTRVNGDHPADVAAWLTDRAAPAWPGQVVRVMPMATILKQQRGRRE